MTELFVILTACPPDHADAIATHLVTGQHAACVSALPGAQSTYRWQAPGQAAAAARRGGGQAAGGWGESAGVC